jgi:EAL domain-containing protein (putative c-di-GMP-specific phosphodiesterase class I)
VPVLRDISKRSATFVGRRGVGKLRSLRRGPGAPGPAPPPDGRRLVRHRDRAITNIEAAVAFSEGLRRRGCRFALDDFGAGFASFDFLKIDGDFINGLPNSPVDQLVVDAIVTIARGMGKQTITEYVTDAETSALLLAAGVDYAQGFHIGRPGPIEGVPASQYGP